MQLWHETHRMRLEPSSSTFRPVKLSRPWMAVILLHAMYSCCSPGAGSRSKEEMSRIWTAGQHVDFSTLVHEHGCSIVGHAPRSVAVVYMCAWQHCSRAVQFARG
jgi:hypothetical protein